VEVVRRAVGHCHEMSTQCMLSICLNALEMEIDRQNVLLMIQEIAGCLAVRTPRIREMDIKKWNQIRRMAQEKKMWEKEDV